MKIQEMRDVLSAKHLHNPKVAAWLLRGGLAFVFGYAAVSSLQHPQMWMGYLPSFLVGSAQAETIIKVFAVVELALAAWLLSGKYVRYAALLAIAMLAGIVVGNPGNLIITFRDIGLVAMAVALFFAA